MAVVARRNDFGRHRRLSVLDRQILSAATGHGQLSTRPLTVYSISISQSTD
jgi:hypothetical protein